MDLSYEMQQNVCVCVCVCVFCVFVPVYICVCVCVYFVCLYVCVYVRIFVCVFFMYLCVCMFVCVCVFIYIYTHIYVHTYVYTYKIYLYHPQTTAKELVFKTMRMKVSFSMATKFRITRVPNHGYQTNIKSEICYSGQLYGKYTAAYFLYFRKEHSFFSMFQRHDYILQLNWGLLVSEAILFMKHNIKF